MRWPARDRPELHQRGKWWVIRWYHPVLKQCRAMRTKNEAYAKAMFKLFETEGVKQ